MKTSAALLTLVLLAPAALAEPTVEPAKPAVSAEASKPQAKTEDDMKVVCKTLEPETGTRLGGRRVCLTKFDWAEQHRSAQEQMNQLPQLNPCSNGPGGKC